MGITTKVEEFKVVVGAGSLYVKRWTPEFAGTQSPLILLHDSLGCVSLWKNFPLLLAQRLSRCVIAYDRLGFGLSDARTDQPSISFIEEEATQYFPAIIKHLSIRRYALLGHSVGGGMAINIASSDPRCEAVITVSAQAFVQALTLKGISAAMKMFAQPGQLERLVKWHGTKAQWVLGAWSNVWLSSTFQNWSLEPYIGSVSCPVLVIHGDNDQYGSIAFPIYIAENTAGVAQTVLLKDCGHMPHKEQPEAVLSAVKGFLESNGDII